MGWLTASQNWLLQASGCIICVNQNKQFLWILSNIFGIQKNHIFDFFPDFFGFLRATFWFSSCNFVFGVWSLDFCLRISDFKHLTIVTNDGGGTWLKRLMGPQTPFNQTQIICPRNGWKCSYFRCILTTFAQFDRC